MSFNGLTLEYALDGSSNYIAWKDRMEAVLEYNGLKEFIDSDVPKPGSSNAATLCMEKEDCKDEEDYVGRCEGPYCVQPSQERHSIINVEGFARLVPKQK